MEKFISIIITWAPTILFCLILLIGFLIGVIRGLRKSRISLIHTLIAGGFCITLFVLFTNLEFFDNLIYNLLGDTLKNTLDVNSNSLTVKGILADYVVVALESVDSAIATAIRENVQYLVALVDMLYKLVVFIICFVLYLILRAILYVCYVLFYPNWRYKIKRNKKFAENSKYKPYKSRRLAGGLIGFCCSLVLFILSYSHASARSRNASTLDVSNMQFLFSFYMLCFP